MTQVHAPHMRVLHLLLILGGGRAAKAPPQPTLSNTDKLVAGGTARAASQLIMYPADALRTLAQTRAGSKTLSELGAKTLVSGCFTTSGFAYFIGALQFGVFGATAAALGPVGASMCGAVASCAVSVPQEVIKQRVQADIYPNALVGVSKCFATDGIAGFYKGYFATVSRDVPWNALSFMFFAQAKKAYKLFTGRTPEGQENLMLGAAAGMTAAVIMTPIDVVKTRLMTGGASGGIVGVMKSIIADEGAATLMKGVLPRVAFLAPLAALTLSLYEVFGKMLVSSRLEIASSEL